VLLAGYRVQGKVGALNQTRMDIMRASDDPEQARIGRHPVVAVLYQHSHFAADSLQPCFHCQCEDVLGVIVRLASLSLKVTL
jgi:hypothetical protein